MTVLSLCSGIGGFETALQFHGHHPSCFVEKDPYCQSILRKNWPNTPILSDLYDPAVLEQDGDILTAGFPCQPVSNAGLMKGPDDERWLYPRIAEVIRVVRPAFVFLENVPGVRKHLALILGPLAELGFDAEWGEFSCASLGAPHIRKRWVLLGYSKEYFERRSAERSLTPLTRAHFSGGQLAHTQRIPVREQPDGQPRCVCTSEPEHAGTHSEGGILADSGGYQRERESECQGPALPPQFAYAHPGTLADGTSAVAHSCGERLHEGAERPEHSPAQCSRPLWPPGRDPAAWRDYPYCHPSESRLRGAPDGFPGEPFRAVYAHQVRGLGNAFSPVVAAVAWDVLIHRLIGGER